MAGVVIDCHDPIALAEWWQQITGFEPTWEQPFVPDPEGDTWASLKDPLGKQPHIAFQKVPEDKVGKNRVHIDLHAPDEEEAASRIVELGGRRLWRSTDPDDPFVVLADPEGNEFCVVRHPVTGASGS
jgi:hypothetical protein